MDAHKTYTHPEPEDLAWLLYRLGCHRGLPTRTESLDDGRQRVYFEQLEGPYIVDVVTGPREASYPV